jgi:hypothetical protein
MDRGPMVLASPLMFAILKSLIETRFRSDAQ